MSRDMIVENTEGLEYSARVKNLEQLSFIDVVFIAPKAE